MSTQEKRRRTFPDTPTPLGWSDSLLARRLHVHCLGQRVGAATGKQESKAHGPADRGEEKAAGGAYERETHNNDG